MMLAGGMGWRITVVLFSPQRTLPLRSVGPEGVRGRVVIGQHPECYHDAPRRSCDLTRPDLPCPALVPWPPGLTHRPATAMSPRRTSVEGSDTMSPASNDQKRKGEDGAPQPRAKRNRYISIAW